MKIFVIGARGVPNIEGGAEKSAEKIFPYVSQHCSVSMLCLDKYTSSRNYMGIDIFAIASPRFLGTDKLWCYLRSIGYVMTMRPDIVHCQGLNAALLVPVYKIFAKKVVVRYGSADYVNKKWGRIGRIGFRICEWNLAWADAVIAVTPCLRERLVSRKITDRIVVLPNAVDEHPAHESVSEPISRFGLESGRYLLSVGRITWQKDYATLIRAYMAAKARQRGIGKLVIVGGDDGSGYLDTLAALGDDDVIFTGRLARDEIASFYSHCGIYINSSLHEGMSNALLEAIGFGAPVIVSGIPENRDLPLGEHHFFEPGDTDQLARKIVAAAMAPATYKIDRGAFQTWEEVAEATYALYRKLLSDQEEAPLLVDGVSRRPWHQSRQRRETLSTE